MVIRLLDPSLWTLGVLKSLGAGARANITGEEKRSCVNAEYATYDLLLKLGTIQSYIEVARSGPSRYCLT